MLLILSNVSALIIALVTLALAIKIRTAQIKIKKRLKKTEIKNFDAHVNEFRQITAFMELKDALQPIRPLPAFREWAISPDFALLLIELLDQYKPQVIVEFGGGNSTLVCAYRCSQMDGGYLHSYDHDADFARLTHDRLRDHHLGAQAEIHHAPLKPSIFLDNASRPIEWYDPSSLLGLTDEIDMVIIDGPPADANSWGRYPALPALYDNLSRHCILVLDDADRESEQQIVARWLREFPEFRLSSRPVEKGAAILVRDPENQPPRS